MFCQKCGAEISEHALACSQCGTMVNPPQTDTISKNQDQRAGFHQGPLPSEPVPSHLGFAIFTTLCCCVPFGIVAIVYAAQVNSKIQAGDYAGAGAASQKAYYWCWIAVGLALAGAVVSLLAKGLLVGLPVCPYRVQ